MKIHPKKRLLLPLLALGMTLAMGASARAQDRDHRESNGPAVSLQISFGSTPHWVGVRGTRVREIRQGERPGYDMFRYGRYYYVYQDNRWYRSRRWRGQFRLIDDRSVPREFRRVPRENWRDYPAAWGGGTYQNDYRGTGTSATLQVTFGSAPHWAGVSGTRVEMISAADRPDYDVFRYGGAYYAYDNNRWYSSQSESGNFNAIDDNAVPSEFSRVPRANWRNYPASYASQKGTPPGLQDKNQNGPGHGNGRGGKQKGHGNR